MISLSLFGGRLALDELILFSVFLTEILLLGIMGEINLSGVLLANATFVLCYVTALGFLQGALPLAAQRFEAGDHGGYHAIVAMSLLLGGGMAVLVLLIFFVFPFALRLFGYSPDLTPRAGAIFPGCCPPTCWRWSIFRCAMASSPPAAAAGS